MDIDWHPAYVYETFNAAIHALRTYKRFEFDQPLLPASGLLRVELRNLPFFGGTRSDIDYILVERSLRGQHLVHTVAHEIFHRVQYTYNKTHISDDENLPREGPFILYMVREGGARVAEQLLGDGTTRYETDAEEWFLSSGLSLVRSRQGPRRAFFGATYQGGLFWKYVAEQHGSQPPLGRSVFGWKEAETQRILLNAIRPPANRVVPTGEEAIYRIDMSHLRRARARMQGPGHFDQFLSFDAAGREIISNETTWGNFLIALALNGTAGEDSRFRFQDAQNWRGITARTAAVAPERQMSYGDLPLDEPSSPITRDDTDVGVFGPATILEVFGEERRREIETQLRQAVQTQSGPPAAQLSSVDSNTAQIPIPRRMLNPYSMLVFKVRMQASSTTQLLRIRWQPISALNDGLVQIIVLDSAWHIQDLYRHDGAISGPMDKLVPCRNVSEVLILVASRENSGDFRLQMSRADENPVLQAASWNCVSGREMTVDPAVFAWDWRSPDVQMRTDGGRGLVVYVRNRGTCSAKNITAQAFRRKIAGEGIQQTWDSRPLTRTDRISEISTDDECRRLIRVTPLAQKDNDIQGSCFFDDERFDPEDKTSNKVFSFLLDETDETEYIYKFVFSISRGVGNLKPSALNDELVVLSGLGRRPPLPSLDPSRLLEWEGQFSR